MLSNPIKGGNFRSPKRKVGGEGAARCREEDDGIRFALRSLGMTGKGNGVKVRTRSSVFVFSLISLCCLFYILGAWQRSGFGKGDSIAIEITKQTDCAILPNLIYDTHHDRENADDVGSRYENFEPCHVGYTDYTPCQDQNRVKMFPTVNMIDKERHCPSEEDKLHCLIPAPKGYAAPFQWPKSRDFVSYANVPYKTLTVERVVESWVHFDGNFFRFPGGGTQFPQGAASYIDQLASVIPIGNGTVRTALDIGCGVASFGAYLFERNVLTMSFAPRDSNEAQVQFALERGVPAVIGVVGTIKLPYPSRSFDMAHCSCCLVPWAANDGMYMMEVDRVLKPGGYWVLSGPPFSWKGKHKAWQVNEKDLEEEKKLIERIAWLLCWEKVSENGEIAIWRKNPAVDSCAGRDESLVRTCEPSYADDVWYKKVETCVVPFPDAGNPEEVAAELRLFPERLNAVPPRIASGLVPGITSTSYQQDIRLWNKHVKAYKRINKYVDNGRYRNIMDMNAGLGSFAAAIDSPKLWVMNVVPTIAEKSTLGAIYERGLIGIYHDWCEAFSTYPRTYDLIHANGVFTLYKNKCKMEDILLEMDRILRPEGAVVLRDNVDILMRVKRIVRGMRWKTKMVDHEDGPLLPEKILFAVKEYWVGIDNDKAAEM